MASQLSTSQVQVMETYTLYTMCITHSLRLQGGKRRQIRVERWLEQLGLEERGSKGAGSEVWQEGGLREVKGGLQLGGGGVRGRERDPGIERKTKDEGSFDMVSQ